MCVCVCVLHITDIVTNVTSQNHYSRSPICYTLRDLCMHTHIYAHKLLGSLVSLQELPSSQWRAAERGIMSLFSLSLSGSLSQLTSVCCLLKVYQLLHYPIIHSCCCVLKPPAHECHTHPYIPVAGSSHFGSAWVLS